jgi:Stress responsive A/B Barrel Domain
MRTKWIVVACAALALAVAAYCTDLEARGEEKKEVKGPALVHNVFFSLKNTSAESKKKFIASCKKHLTKHPGEVTFAVGPLVADLKRPVNDVAFDISLTIVFESRAAHDKYQDAKRHLAFIDENKENWKKVRVFDSYAD